MNTLLTADPAPSHDKLRAETPLPTSYVLGVRFHCLRIAEAIQVIEQYIAHKSPHQVCLANAYTLALARKDSALLETLNRSDLVLADGMSIVWGGQWVGATIPERVAGPDLTEALCRVASRRKYRIFLLGSTDDILRTLTTVLQSEWPEIQIVGSYSPPFCDRLTEEMTNKITPLLKEAQPDILFVSMSAPKQEKWISENLPALHVPVAIGVGAAFDFLSGRIPRAPKLLRDIGLEWLYRLYREPRRLWKRYLLGNLVFLSLLIREVLRGRANRSE